MSCVVVFKFWRRDIEASSPYLDLIFSMLFDSFKLVESLQSSIMSLVKSPILNNRNVMTIKFFSSVVESLNSAGQS